MLSPDTLLERIKLKRAVSIWRLLFFFSIALLVTTLGFKNNIKHNLPSYIARVTIEGQISQDSYEIRKLQMLINSNQIKAVVLSINSPGGTAYGGEDLYSYINQIAQKKPVVTVIKTIATSAAYMVASPSHHIVARNNSLTGSIGAIVSSPDASIFLDKLGIKFNTIKKGDLKADPSLYHPINEATKKMLLSLIDDNYTTFFNIILKHRKLNQDAITQISDSRIFTGNQAKSLNLIDEIGGEDEALKWLENHKKIILPIRDFELKTPESSFKAFVDKQLLSTTKAWINNSFSSFITMYQ